MIVIFLWSSSAFLNVATKNKFLICKQNGFNLVYKLSFLYPFNTYYFKLKQTILGVEEFSEFYLLYK